MPDGDFGRLSARKILAHFVSSGIGMKV